MSKLCRGGQMVRVIQEEGITSLLALVPKGCKRVASVSDYSESSLAVFTK